jgi:hypothetical protein
MPMPSKVDVLYDQSSVANTALDTGNLNTADYDALLVEVQPSGAAGASTIGLCDAALSTTVPLVSLATPATASIKTAAFGPGAIAAASAEYVGGIPGPVPALSRVLVGALGVGITAHVRVLGRRQFRGDVAVNTSADGLTPRVLD